MQCHFIFTVIFAWLINLPGSAGSQIEVLSLFEVKGRALTQANPGLPEDPDSTCSTATLVSIATSADGCFDVVLSGQGNQPCCDVLDGVLGVGSNATTRNCFCIADVLSDVGGLAAGIGAAPFTNLIDSCNTKYASKIGYFGEKNALCPNSKPPPSDDTEDPQLGPPGITIPSANLPTRSLGEWISDLGKEPAFLVPFIMSFPAGLGVLAFIWILLSAMV
ncbi:hypothetical protein BSKO_03361 [Bryopsis sp. KO-2023]|nr:hypothetical protein BSKO_03361 [Bryopsis sp. KO-2023]